jgi:hypothetical protein
MADYEAKTATSGNLVGICSSFEAMIYRRVNFDKLEEIRGNLTIANMISNMRTTTEVERRDRAVVAFALATGARDGAMASMRLKYVDLATGRRFDVYSEYTPLMFVKT